MGLGLKLPPVRLDLCRCAKVGREVVEAIQKYYPGGFSDESKVVFRWGQDTRLPKSENTVIFDCGYFRRERGLRGGMHFRVSINEYHPTKLPAAKAARWNKLNLELKNYYDPNGHALLAGRGRKTRIKSGTSKPDWEIEAIKKIKAAYPGKKIIYRPKKMPRESLPGTTSDSFSSIEDLCRGCALVYAHSSNVANEAILYGVPAFAEGGPAADVCTGQPMTEAERLDFLHRLAWWQWSVDEVRRGDIWPWLFKQIKARSN